MRGAHGGGRGGGKREKKPIPEEGPYRSFVGNLPLDMVQGEFDQIFQGLSISSIHMMRDRETDVFKGFAYVEFGNREDLEKALDLDGVEFDKKIVRIDVAEDRRKDRPNNRFGPPTRGGRGGDRGGNGGHHRGGREFVRSDRHEGRGGPHQQHQRRHSPKTDQSGFQRVERGGFRGNRGRGDIPHNSRGNGHRRGGGHEAAAPSVRISAEPDPERPKLILKPRTTDPEELERRRIQEEEERKKRQEKICTAKRDEE